MSKEGDAMTAGQEVKRLLNELEVPPLDASGECLLSPLSTEDLLDIMRGNTSCLSTPVVKQHLQACTDCCELVEYARRQQSDYEQRKEEFLASIQKNKPRALPIRWLQGLKPLRAATKPRMSWAVAAIVATALASLPFVFAPTQEDPAMVNTLRRIAGLRTDDIDSAQKITNDLKVATIKGTRQEPTELRDVRNAIDNKRNSADNENLKQGWTVASDTMAAVELANRYQIDATASGSPDSLETLEVKDVKVEKNNAEVQIQRKPQNEEEFVFVVRTAKNQVGLQNVNVTGPNGFRKQIQ